MICKYQILINYTCEKKENKYKEGKWQNTTQTKHRDVDYKNKKTKQRWNISQKSKCKYD